LSRATSLVKNVSCKLLKKTSEVRRAKFDEPEAYALVRRSESRERNDTYEFFSAAC
jgi:hypothetical protein